MSELQKDPSILDTLCALKERFGDALKVVDHWEVDSTAVGVARAERPEQLVYFSTSGRGADRYYVEVECAAPAGSDLPFEQSGTFNDIDFDS